MAKNFITGNAQSVRNSVERVAELSKRHPEWDTPPSPKALARERLKPVKPSQVSPAEGGTFEVAARLGGVRRANGVAFEPPQHRPNQLTISCPVPGTFLPVLTLGRSSDRPFLLAASVTQALAASSPDSSQRTREC